MAVYSSVSSEELYHYGIPRKSGRYPYGSGREPYQDNPKKRRLNKDESAPKATSKRPESIWAKRRKAQISEFAKKALNKKKKEDVRKVSDEELRRRIARINLEKQYRDAVKSQSIIGAGKRYMKSMNENSTTVSSIVANTSKTLASWYAIYVTSKKIYELLEKNK